MTRTLLRATFTNFGSRNFAVIRKGQIKRLFLARVHVAPIFMTRIPSENPHHRQGVSTGTQRGAPSVFRQISSGLISRPVTTAPPRKLPLPLVHHPYMRGRGEKSENFLGVISDKIRYPERNKLKRVVLCLSRCAVVSPLHRDFPQRYIHTCLRFRLRDAI